MTASEYLKHWEKNKVWTHINQSRHRKRFKTCADYCEGKTFVDVGCVYGHSTKLLSTLKSGIWSGLDFAEKAIIRAKELFPEISFYYAKDYDLLPICGKFDSVICTEVIEHVPEDKIFINSLINITNKILIVTTPNKHVNDPGHLRLYTEESLSKLFENYNFEIIKTGPFFYIIVRK